MATTQNAAVLDAPAQPIAAILRSDLRVAPWNARKTIDETALADLTASIEQKGIITPLLVRPFGQAGSFYEIVAGHRRYEAAARANMETLPCTVREMTDDEAREIGLVENMQREDLQPLEEANAYGELMRSPGATIETVAAKIGKAPSYVARRLRLLDTIPEVRNALTAGAIEVGHALELARLDGNQQLKLLQKLNVVANEIGGGQFDEEEDDFIDDEENDQDEPRAAAEGGDEQPLTRWQQTPISVAELRRMIGQTTLRVLSDAPFPLDDEIPPVACAECPKRSTNAALLFSDFAQDTCTDRECYNGKIRAWVRYSLEQAEEHKKPLLQLSGGYHNDKSILQRWDVTVIDGERVEACEKQEEAIWIDGEHAGHRVMICRAADCATHRRSLGGGSAADEAKRKADRKKVLARVKIEKRYRTSLFDALAKAPLDITYIPGLANEVARYCLHRMSSIYAGKVAEALGWDPKTLRYDARDALEKKLATLSPAECLRAAALASHADERAVQEYNLKAVPKGLERVAAHLGIDAKAIRKAAEIDPEKPAAKTAKGAPSVKPAEKKATRAKPAAKKSATKKPVAKRPAAKKSPVKKAAKPKK